MARISLRIDQELYDKIEAHRGDTDRSSYIKNILVAHTDSGGHTNETHLYDEIEYLRLKLDEALKLVTQSQILQMQAQRQLTEAQEIKNKTVKWWQFWKK